MAIQVTEQQVIALDNLTARFDEPPTAIEAELFTGSADECATLIVVFPFLTIGIETDGYAHS